MIWDKGLFRLKNDLGRVGLEVGQGRSDRKKSTNSEHKHQRQHVEPHLVLDEGSHSLELTEIHSHFFDNNTFYQRNYWRQWRAFISVEKRKIHNSLPHKFFFSLNQFRVYEVL